MRKEILVTRRLRRSTAGDEDTGKMDKGWVGILKMRNSIRQTGPGARNWLAIALN
jgi:hypothetical protein